MALQYIVSIQLEQEAFHWLQEASQDQARPLEDIIKEHWKEFVRHVFATASLGEIIPLMEDFGLKHCVILNQDTLALLNTN